MKIKLKISLLIILISCFFAQAQTFNDSNLPIVIITTDVDGTTGQPLEIADQYRIGASMKIIYRPDGSRNFLTDETNPSFLNYNGRISIEIKGSSSQSLEKKPYGLTTLQNDNTTNNNVSILTMPQENDWVLNSLAFDRSLIRDYLSYDLSRDLGNYAPRGKFCEVVINGDYRGLYILMEKIKDDSRRVNIIELTNNDNNLPNVSGGYITKCDNTSGNDTVAWQFETNISNTVSFLHHAPNPETITQAQNDYIFNIFNSLETVMNNQNASIVDGYPSIIDVPTFVDFMMINELASNVDAYQLSTYFHKDRNGKLRAGPIWDFNMTYGLDVFGKRSGTDVWQFDNDDSVGAKFWKNLFDNPIFKCYMSRRWVTVTAPNMPLNIAVMNNKIDGYVALLSEASIREDSRWNTENDFQSNIDDVKNWLQARIDWLNQNLTLTDCSFPELPTIVISKINYNPLSNGSNNSNALEFIELTNNSNATADVSGFYFKELGITYVFPTGSSISPNGKIYLASDSAAFEQEYSFAPFGTFIRNLSNKSQNLSLADPFGNLVDFVEYADTAPWPVAADGNGSYLTLADLNADNALASSWTATTQTLETAGFEIEKATIVYPNPTTSMLFILNPRTKIKGYEIIDYVGRIIVSENNILNHSISINIKNMASQNYLLKIILENGAVLFRKIIKD